MASKKSIKLEAHQDQLLRDLHRQSGIPDGQFAQRPSFWLHFTETWNNLTDRNDSPDDVLHYIMTRRKRPHGRPGRWFTFGENYERLSSPETSVFNKEQWAEIGALYVEVGLSADALLVDPVAREEFSAAVLDRTGVHVPDLYMVAMLITRRKEGLLPTTDSQDNIGDIGFGDIDEVA